MSKLPLKWELQANLIDDIDAADTMIFKKIINGG